MSNLHISKGVPIPVPLDEVTLTPTQMLEALREYVLKHCGRTVDTIIGVREEHSSGRRQAVYSAVLTLKPESK